MDARRPSPYREACVDEIRALLAAEPTMPATVIAERIGWTRSMTQLKARVAERRPLFKPPDPVQRTTYAPGELAQWDLWPTTTDSSG
jgi:hypothetical protein